MRQQGVLNESILGLATSRTVTMQEREDCGNKKERCDCCEEEPADDGACQGSVLFAAFA